MDYETNLDIEYVYLINEDLKMSAGKIASQVSHVAMMLAVDSIYQFNTYDLPTLHDDYRYVIGKAIVLKAPESLLKQIIADRYAKDYWIKFLSEGDAGLTEVPEGSITCIGFQYPYIFCNDRNKKLREISKKLKLV